VDTAFDDVETAERRDPPGLSEVSWALREVIRLSGAVDDAVTRRLIVETTDSARRDVLAVLAPLLAGVDAIAHGLSDDEAVTVTRYLGAVAEAMRRFGVPTDPGRS